MSEIFKTAVMKNEAGHIIIIQDMMHVAPQSFFDVRMKEWKDYSNQGYIALAEGLDAPQSMSGIKKFYQLICDITGLSMQPHLKHLDDVNSIQGDMSWNMIKYVDKAKLLAVAGVVSIGYTAIKKTYNLNQKDNESNIFPEKVELINAIRRAMRDFSDKSSSGKPKTVKDFIRKVVIEEVLLDNRNKHVVNLAVQQLSNVILPWGKAHSPGIISLLNQKGYKFVEETSLDIGQHFDIFCPSSKPNSK